MFLLKKIISAMLLPPGCFIVILVGAGIWSISRRRRWCGIFAVSLGLLLYGLSLPPAANYLMKRLENGITIPARLQGDVIILLGGGVNVDAADLTGIGAPTDDMMSRLVTAVRAQKLTGLPIIVSGGSLKKTDIPESRIVQRFLLDLGVPRVKILLEEKSRDTGENAVYSAELCARNGFRQPLLVTSAYHMKRSLLIFHRNHLDVTPLPASFRHSDRKEMTPSMFLPEMWALACTATALHEYLGILYYERILMRYGPSMPETRSRNDIVPRRTCVAKRRPEPGRLFAYH